MVDRTNQSSAETTRRAILIVFTIVLVGPPLLIVVAGLAVVGLAPLGAFEYQRETVGIFQLAPPPQANGFRMLWRSVRNDFDRGRQIAAILISHAIQVMVRHVRQSAAFVIPVAAVGATETVRAKRPQRRRSTVHIPIQLGRHVADIIANHAAPLFDFQSSAMDDRRVQLTE